MACGCNKNKGVTGRSAASRPTNLTANNRPPINNPAAIRNSTQARNTGNVPRTNAAASVSVEQRKAQALRRNAILKQLGKR